MRFNVRHSLAHPAVLATVVCLLAPVSARSQDLTEDEALGRVSLDSAPARRVATALRLQPVVWEGEIDRRVRAEARTAFARLVAAQAQAAAVGAAAASVREIAAGLARAEDAGDAAGFDRVQAERALADLEAWAADLAEARARAQADVAAYFAGVADPRALRVVGRPVPSGAALPPADALAERALARTHTAPAAGPIRAARVPSSPPADEAAMAARRAETRIRVLSLAAIVTERRASTGALRRAALAAADDLARIARVSYDNGVRGTLDLLAAYRAGVEARVRIAEAELALRRAEIELEALTGETLP